VRAGAAQQDSLPSSVSGKGRVRRAVEPGSRERGALRGGDLTPAGAATELRCSRTLIYRLIERGELPGTYELPGSNRKRIPRADILALKERHRVQARLRVPVYEPVPTSTKGRGSDSFADEVEAIERGEAA
jgi:excisionase family DNA binding protein